MERRFESVVSATPERVWQWVTSMKCINRELSPLMRMTHPADRESLGDVELEMPAHLFDSLLLLFGWLPIDRSRLTLLELEPGRRFLERSPMLAMKLWQHERTVEASRGGTRVVDRLSAPHARRAVEVEKAPRAIARGVLDQEVPVEHQRLDAREQ